MQITVSAKSPAPRPEILFATIDLGETRRLTAPATLTAHPAHADLKRRRAVGEPSCPYLAIGTAPLLYLPSQAAPHSTPDEQIRALAALAYDAAEQRTSDHLAILLDGEAGAGAAPLVAEGLAMRHYRFAKYKPSVLANRRKLKVTLVVPERWLKGVRTAVKDMVADIAAVSRARDLVNEPGSIATPQWIEDRARELAREHGLSIKVLNVRELEKQGYNGLPTVGRGGNVPPRMIILNYDPAETGPAAGARGARRAGPRLGLLGKGLTFDNGGVSIKPAEAMWKMKGDMSGAAAVLYATGIIARHKPKIPVTTVIVTAQNYVDANSMMPGDIFIAKNGKSVHVDNTDAEGRLILSDGLCRMGEEGVTHLIDVATLTGACMRALGDRISGVFCNDDAFCALLKEAATAHGEPIWRLPLWEEYAERLKFEIADVNNMGAQPVFAGATLAALFLREFVPDGVKWAHLDIAGTFFTDGHKYFRPGATGVMTRTLAAVAERLAETN